jgi:hypothetical protein
MARRIKFRMAMIVVVAAVLVVAATAARGAEPAAVSVHALLA